MSILLAILLSAGAMFLCWPGAATTRLSVLSAGRPRQPGPMGQPRLAERTRISRRHESAVTEEIERELPIALDLIALCCAAGSSPAVALTCVGRALRGPLGADLLGVARALDLGATAEQAWVPALVGRPPSMRQAAGRFAQSERSGAALGPTLAVLAANQRSLLALARAKRARRVGVLAAAPLGLCFLPAFVLTGVLPVIVGLVQQLPLS